MSIREDDEQGIISIVVTIIVMVVITITVLGFAQLARREERQALDRQLSSAAAHAAESGINVAASKVRTDTLAGTALTPKSTCAPIAAYSPNGPTDNQMALPAAYATMLGGITVTSEYTCLLVDPQPVSLEYSSIPVDTSVRADFNLVGSGFGLAQYLVIGWSGNSKNFTPTGMRTLPSVQEWKDTSVTPNVPFAPMLRADVTNLMGNDYSRNGMANKTYTGFFYPETGGTNNYGTTTFGPGNTGTNRGEIVAGGCNTAHPTTGALAKYMPQDCNVVIDVSSALSNHFMIRLKGIYNSSRVTVRAIAFDGSQLNLTGAQTIIDATGKSGDVLKRQQVRVSTQPRVFSDYAVQSVDSICKRLFTTSAATGTSRDLSVPASETSCNP